MREALKTFARHFVAGRTLTRRLPASVGGARVVVSPESQLKYLKPGRSGFDPLLLHWAEQFVRPGETVWDIGANVGVFSFSAAGRGASVLAVEADPYMASLLLRSRQLNPELGVDVLTCAIADQLGFATLQIASGGRAANALAQFAGIHMPFGQALADVHIPTTTLDSLASEFGPPNLVKIDIEGAELLALLGATSLLGSMRPQLIVETCANTRGPIANLLAEYSYETEDLFASNWLATPR